MPAARVPAKVGPELSISDDPTQLIAVTPPEKPQRGGALGWVLLVVLAGAVAGAYFGGVIPH